MRTLNHPITLTLAAAVVFAAAAPAEAGSFFRYETEDGAIAYTDDAKRIPARYRGEAAPVARQGLDDFERFTPMAPSQPTTYAQRLSHRLVYLRDFNDRTRTPHVSTAPPAHQGAVTVRSSNRGNVVETTSLPDEEPTIVDTIRVRPNGQHVTEHWTVVRRGDEVVSIIQPRGRQQDSRWVKESDLLR